MTRTSFIALPMILLVFVLSAVKPVQGEFKTTTITEKISGKKITFDIYVPENYRKKGVGYPVIYSLHGRGGFYQNGGAVHPPIKKAIADGVLPPVIAVYPDGTKNSWYADSKDRTILIETHIIREIIPWIDTNYNTKSSRGFRVIPWLFHGRIWSVTLSRKVPRIIQCMH
jgi:enterochelin esterase-like enzyme